jgi:hypothetical protein
MSAENKITSDLNSYLSRRVEEFNHGPVTPESVKNILQTMWDVWGVTKGGPKTSVPKPSETDIKEAIDSGDLFVFVPKGLTLSKLSKMFPSLNNYPASINDTVVAPRFTGTIRVEASIDSPYPNSSERELIELFKEKERKGIDEISYIVASQTSYALSGHFLDEKTTSRLIGSRQVEGRIARASFFRNGTFYADWTLGAEFKASDLGGRSFVSVRTAR